MTGNKQEQINEQETDGTEWFIHRYECPECGAMTRADRAVGCFRCGSKMEHVERIGEVVDSAPSTEECE